jgi:hypothetical protein
LPHLSGHLGDWVERFFDARTLSTLNKKAFPVEGERALAPVDRLVADRARSLRDRPDASIVR